MERIGVGLAGLMGGGSGGYRWILVDGGKWEDICAMTRTIFTMDVNRCEYIAIYLRRERCIQGSSAVYGLVWEYFIHGDTSRL